jgi:hypothetical protein
MCRPCGTFRCVVCRIVVPGFGPWRDVGDLQGARCVRISAEVEPPQCGVIVVEPPQCDGSTAFAAAEVLPRMQGVPLLTAFAAEWWGAAGGNRGRWAAREKAPATARPSPPPISLSSPRLRRTIPPPPAALSGISRFAICGAAPHGFALRFHPTLRSFVACALTPTLRLRLVRGSVELAINISIITQFFKSKH